MKKYNALFFFLMFAAIGFGQNKEIDSLKLLLRNTTLHDTVKIKTYFILAGKYGGYSLDSLKKYTMKAVDLSKLNDNYLLDGAYYYMGLYHKNIGETEKAKEYYLKAIPLIDSINDKNKLAKILSNYANTLNETSDLKEKIAYNIKALKLREAIGDKPELGQSQFNLAVVYSNTGYDSLSSKYLKLALKNAEESNHKVLSGYVLGSMVMYALKNDDLEKVKRHLQKAEKICKETGSNLLYVSTFKSKGRYLDKLKRFDDAEEAFKVSLDYAHKRKSKADIMFAYASLGKHYVLSENPIKAIKNFKKFEQYKNDNAEPKVSQLAYQNWSKAEEMVGNFKKSNEYLQKYVNIKDSLNVVKNKILLVNAEVKYQTEKKRQRNRRTKARS